MATLVTLPRPRASARAHQSAREPLAPTKHKATMVAACYAGLAGIVMLAFIVRAVAPAPIAAVLFVLAAAGLVGFLHPRVHSRASDAPHAP